MRHFFSRWQMATPVLTMKHALGAFFSVIHDQPVTTCETLLLCNGPGSEHQVAQQTFVSVFSRTDALLHPPRRAHCAEDRIERLYSRDAVLSNSDRSQCSQ